jgi:hypothetical protein
MPTQQVKVIQITNVDYHAKLNTSPPAGFPTGSSASG